MNDKKDKDTNKDEPKKKVGRPRIHPKKEPSGKKQGQRGPDKKKRKMRHERHNYSRKLRKGRYHKHYDTYHRKGGIEGREVVRPGENFSEEDMKEFFKQKRAAEEDNSWVFFKRPHQGTKREKSIPMLVRNKEGRKTIVKGTSPLFLRQHKLTYSSFMLYLTCPKKYKFKILDKLVPLQWDVTPLRFGSHFHDLLELFLKNRILGDIKIHLESKYPDRDMVPGHLQEFTRLWAMINAYARQYPIDKDDFMVLDTEVPFELPFKNPDKRSYSRNWKACGKVDATAKRIYRSNDLSKEKIMLLEHKTAMNVDPAMMQQKVRWDWQGRLYCYFMSQYLAQDVDTVVYNLCCKPSIRLRKNDTADDYFNRIMEWYEADQTRITRLEAVFTPVEQRQAARTMWKTGIEINTKRNTRNGEFLCNPGGCSKWGRLCSYWPICSSYENPIIIKNQFKKVEPHSELVTEEKDPGDVFN